MIKTFGANSPWDLDQAVNEWEENNQGQVEILDWHFSLGQESGNDIRVIRPVYGCMIVYREQQSGDADLEAIAAQLRSTAEHAIDPAIKQKFLEEAKGALLHGE